MGGAGVATLGLLYARHFCFVQATIGQGIPRNHRPTRLTQLSSLWGSPQRNLDGGQGLGSMGFSSTSRGSAAQSPEARQQFLFLHHGKDDTTIHFGAVVLKSPHEAAPTTTRCSNNTSAISQSGTRAATAPRIRSCPTTGGKRLEPGVRRHRIPVAAPCLPCVFALPADRNPGTGHGNGRQSWNEDGGYAGKLDVAEDTGWDGEIAGSPQPRVALGCPRHRRYCGPAGIFLCACSTVRVDRRRVQGIRRLATD